MSAFLLRSIVSAHANNGHLRTSPIRSKGNRAQMRVGMGSRPARPGGASALSRKDTRRVAAFRAQGATTSPVRPLPRPGPRFSCDPACHTTATIKRMFPRAERPTAGSRRGPSAAGALCAVDKAVTTVTLSRREKGAQETGRGKNATPRKGGDDFSVSGTILTVTGGPARPERTRPAAQAPTRHRAQRAGLGAQRRGPDSPRAKRASLPRTVY